MLNYEPLKNSVLHNLDNQILLNCIVKSLCKKSILKDGFFFGITLNEFSFKCRSSKLLIYSATDDKLEILLARNQCNFFFSNL